MTRDKQSEDRFRVRAWLIDALEVLVLSLLSLPSIAASTNEVGFHADPAFPSPASASTARYLLQLGRLKQFE